MSRKDKRKGKFNQQASVSDPDSKGSADPDPDRPGLSPEKEKVKSSMLCLRLLLKSECTL